MECRGEEEMGGDEQRKGGEVKRKGKWEEMEREK